MKYYLSIVLFLFFIGTVYGQTTLQEVDAQLINAEYAKAIETIEKKSGQNTDIYTSVALENKKAEALIHLGKFEAADTILKQAQQKLSNANNKFLAAALAATQGFLYLNQGRNDLALQVLQKASSQFDLLGKGNSLENAQALSYLGQTYINTGKYTQAEEQLQRALTLRQNELKNSHELIAASYNDLGLVYSFLGDNDKALAYYEKALALYTTLHEKEHPKIAIVNTNMGIIYRNLELYGDAINNFETALAIWKKVYPLPHPSKAFVLFNLGQTHSKMGDQKTAQAFYNESLKMYTDSYAKKHPDIARVLNAIGNVKLSSNLFTEALANYQQALKMNVGDFNDDDVKHNPKLKNFYNGNVLLYTLLFKAQAFESRYYGTTLKFADLSTALYLLHTCDTLVDKLRQQTTSESDKLALGIVANELYSDGVRIAYNAGINSLNKKKYFEEAFYFAEKSKSAVLLEAISDTEAKSFAGIPPSLLEEEKSLKSAIALCTQKLAQMPSAEEEKNLRGLLFSLNRNYETFTKKLELEYPGYFNLKFNSAAPLIHDIKKLLDDKTTVISYFNDEKNNRLYIFLIRKNKFQIIDRPLPKGFNKNITGLRNSLFFNDLTIFTQSAQNLYKILIPKLSLSTKHLVILPTGRLGIIPFETLLTQAVNKKNNDYKNLPYLLKKYSIRYEFSAGLLLQKAKEKQDPGAPSIFLCAPVNFDEKDNLNGLPGTESEVQEIASLFKNKNYSNALYLNNEANEKLVKSNELKNFKLLHFATHGIVDEMHPELSRVFLKSCADAEDGNLFTGEIYNLELNANLVTLSACQTGLGKISKGEGVIGLSRALVYAGAKNVMVSFWSVADESTSILMKDFYKLLLENNPGLYADNLRTAKLHLLANSEYSAPYYWAPFILIGF